MTKSSRDHYKVGKGKPPAHSQFKPGQSGNPSGKKKGTLSLKAALEHTLQRPINYRENGEPKTMTALEAQISQLSTLALKGNLKAIAMVLSLAERLLDVDPEAAVETPEEDLEILRRVLGNPQLHSQMTGDQGRQQDHDPSGPQESGDD